MARWRWRRRFQSVELLDVGVRVDDIPAEAVEFMNDQYVKDAIFSIHQHRLEFRSEDILAAAPTLFVDLDNIPFASAQ